MAKMITKVDIHDMLKNAGVSPSDTVLIHTSMRSLGEVEGGCDGVIDGFISYLTDGLFLVPTHTWANVNKNQPIYDVKNTPPCIGALPTVAAKRPDGIRSLHPTHSMWAHGKRAAEFVRGEEVSKTPCPAGGAWARLYDEDAKIIMLGVGIDKLTYIHAIDEMLDLPERLSEEKELVVIDYCGNEHKVSFRSHSHATSQYFVNYEKALDYLGIIKRTRLGDADVLIISAKELTEALKSFWEKADYDLSYGEYRDIPEHYYKEEA